LVALTLVTGCGAPIADALPDKWLGHWNGPEGTSLLLAGGKGKYEVTIRNLDGPATFQGRAVGGAIEFEREGIDPRDQRSRNGNEMARRQDELPDGSRGRGILSRVMQ
jgi:hypothetical protein